MPIRWTVVGCVPNRICQTPGGSGSEMLRTVILRSKPMNARGSWVMRREKESALASTARDSTFEAAVKPNVAIVDRQDDRRQRRGTRLDARVAQAPAPPERLGEPLGQEGPGRRDERQPDQAADHVVVLLVARARGRPRP